MAYDPPSLTQLRAKVARDLRDEAANVFVQAQIDDFINMGIAELNAVRPVETRIEYPGDTDFAVTTLPFEEVFAVEFAVQQNVGDVLRWDTLHPANSAFGYGRSGWDFFAGKLQFPGIYVSGIGNLVERYTAAQVYVAIWGYANRDLLLDGADIATFENAIDELIVRAYAKAEGFRALSNDRALFQQWQEQANNSDVSATQLLNMMGTAQGDFDRMRKRHHKMRRPRTG